MKTNLFLSLIVLSILFSCKNSDKVKETVTAEESGEIKNVSLNAEQVKNAGIQTGAIEKKELTGVIRCNGVLDVPPQNLVSISAVLGGFVKSTDLLQGMRVKKGQVLCILEHPDYIQLQQDYLDIKSKYEFAKAEYERQKELSADNINSKRTFQEKESEYKSLEAKFGGLEQKLEMININPKALEQGKISRTVTLVSPINGFVKEVNVNIGKYVSQHEVMFEIIDAEHLHAELTVFEKDISKIKEGQKIKFTLPNENGKERTAVVHLIARSISNDKTARIHGHLDQEDPSLLPGMYIKAEIEVQSGMVSCLPEEAILFIDEKNFVFIETASGSFELTEIKTGITSGRLVEVETASLENKKIVLKGVQILYSALKNSSEPKE